MLVDLGSDQTSLHNPYNGGYYPVGLGFDEANKLMASNPEKFKEAVKERWKNCQWGGKKISKLVKLIFFT